MKIVEQVFPGHIIEALGWTIIHTLWQGALLALVLGVVLLILRNKSSLIRYWISTASLFIFLIAAVVTFIIVDDGIILTSNQPVSQTNTTSATALLNTSLSDMSVSDPGFIQSMANLVSDYFYRNLALVVVGWFLGVMFFILRHLGGVVYTQRLRHAFVKPVGMNWQSKLHEIASKLQYHKKVRFLESGLARVPLVMGYFKPLILFPVGVLSGLPVNQVEAILVHELAHLIRKDAIINLFQNLMEILFFYHPALWWISSLIRNERENICDDMAVAYKNDHLNYVKALANLEEIRQQTPVYTFSLIGTKNHLLKRIKRIMKQKRSNSQFRDAFLIASLLITGGIFLSADEVEVPRVTANTEISYLLPFSQPYGKTPVKHQPSVEIGSHSNNMLPTGKHKEYPRRDTLEKLNKLKGEIQRLNEYIEQLKISQHNIQESLLLEIPEDSLIKDQRVWFLYKDLLNDDFHKRYNDFRYQDALKGFRYRFDYQLNDSAMETFKAVQDSFREALEQLHQQQAGQYQKIRQEFQEKLKEAMGDSILPNQYHRLWDFYSDSSGRLESYSDFIPDFTRLTAYDAYTKSYNHWLNDFYTHFIDCDAMSREAMNKLIEDRMSEQLQISLIREGQIDVLKDIYKQKQEVIEELRDKGFFPGNELSFADIQEIEFDMQAQKTALKGIQDKIRESERMLAWRNVDTEMRIIREFRDELYKDGLIHKYKSLDILFIDKSMYINNEKQSKKINKKYRKLYEQLTGKKLKQKTSLRF